MKRYLVIEDSPKERCRVFNHKTEIVYIAHTLDQIAYWLTSGIVFDAIILDHDLGMKQDGTDICVSFGADIVASTNFVLIWSHNPDGAERMMRLLNAAARELGTDTVVETSPFNGAIMEKVRNYLK